LRKKVGHLAAMAFEERKNIRAESRGWELRNDGIGGAMGKHGRSCGLDFH
jgi:hypothetical protein